ncbi:aminoglycoside phosphotransferase family protein [Rickettsia endosymbiont of Orchestes rusci]|uniref:aminoglycoside phosphotransferase family protein n=1 Tax=Rickettsia endosymbiont of Orchestes rusci TaxID=3066250 RepID=UPI00313DB812
MNILTKNIISLYKEQGKIWLKGLPQIIAAIAKKWHLSELKPVDNLSFNYVLSGFQNDKPIILKLGFDKESLMQEAEALKIFEGYGAVRLLEQQHNALLLERAISGISLKAYSLKENNEKIIIACEAVKKLHQAPLPKTTHFPCIQDQHIKFRESRLYSRS